MFNGYDIVGFCGGLIMASALVPQSYRVIVRRSAVDISYAYQAFFAVGLIMFVAFYGYFELWPLFCTSVLSLSSMIFMIVVKLNLEGMPARTTAMAPTTGVGGSEDGSGARSSYSLRGGTAGAKSTSSASSDTAGKSIEVQPLMSSW